jgi:rod shape-determining protein MreC
LTNENAHLRDEVTRLAADVASLESVELQRLPFDVVRAPVSAYDASAFGRSLWLRAPSSSGIVPGMAVTADGALAGLVLQSGPHQCQVRLITDPHSVLPCRVSRARALCILQGRGDELCTVEWLDKDAFVEEGDVLVTAVAGAGPDTRSLALEGIPVATVVRVERDSMRPLFLSVEAEPRIDLTRLEACEILIPQQTGDDD